MTPMLFGTKKKVLALMPAFKKRDADRPARSPILHARLVQPFASGSSTAHPMNLQHRLGRLRDLGILNGDWLDCGCANGSYTAALLDYGTTTAVGVDTLTERIARAHSSWASLYPQLRFVSASAEGLPFPDASFDGVLLNEVLEHVTDELQTLREIFRILRPGGHLVIMSPNRWFPFEGHGLRLGSRRLEFPVPLLPWLPRSVGQRFMWARNYWPGELREIVHHQGFIICLIGFVWPVLEQHPWLPRPFLRHYRAFIPMAESLPLLRRFGLSILLVAHKP